MVKDKEGRYPDSALWGDGWGWGFFGADDPGKLVTTDYKLECKSCHVPAKDTDWIYTRAYPALSE
ncbi:MAG: cytochrome P460 family protein, partial [Pseudomonadota bacterium]